MAGGLDIQANSKGFRVFDTDTPSEQFITSLPKSSQERIREEREAATKLMFVYEKAFRSRYNTEPMVDSSGKDILAHFFRTLGFERSSSLLLAYINCNHDYFTKNYHDLPSLKRWPNIAMAEIGRKARVATGPRGPRMRITYVCMYCPPSRQNTLEIDCFHDEIERNSITAKCPACREGV